MLTCSEARKYFPFLNNGTLYFNHAALGPISTLVKQSLDKYILQRSETLIENYIETLPQVNEAKKRIARMLNVEKSRIAWIDNVSNALSLVASGISWKRGDQIILNDLEFPSNVYPFLNLKNEGVEILFAKSNNGKVGLEQIETLVTNNTKLISISMVQFLTGYRADLKSIGEFCKEKGIIFCVDGIQGAGVVQINPEENNIDFFTGGSQKWLMGLQGSSYFYISQQLQDRILQKYVGWTSTKDAWNLLNYDLTLLDTADRYQNGTNSRIGLIAIDASLKLFEEIGYDIIEQSVLNNTEHLINLLSEAGFNVILKDTSRENRAGIVTFKHDKAELFVNKLKEENVICSVREGMIRLSPHFYNNKEDLEKFVEILNDITARL